MKELIVSEYNIVQFEDYAKLSKTTDKALLKLRVLMTLEYVALNVNITSFKAHNVFITLL